MKNLIWSGLASFCVAALCVVTLCVGPLCFVTPAAAQGVLVADVFDDTGEAQCFDPAFNYFGNVDNNVAQNLGLDFNDVANAPFSLNGYSAVGYAAQNAAYVPSNPGISGNFGVHQVTGSASGTVFSSGNWVAQYTYGLPFGQIIFSVAQNTQWSLTGNVSCNTLAVGSGISQSEHLIRFQKYLNNNIFLVNDSNQALNGVGNYNDILNYSGVLPPGTYIYEYKIFSQHGGSQFSPPIPGSANAAFNLTLTLTAVPEPATLLLLLFAATTISPRLRRG